MTSATMKAAVAILAEQGFTVTLEPGTIHVERSGWIYCFGDANEEFGADVYANWKEYEGGGHSEEVLAGLPSDTSDPAAVAKAVTDAISAHQARQEPRFYVLNETDGILAHPDPMTRAKADEFMIRFRARFERQGYYKSAAGYEVPVSELRLKRIPEGEL